MNEQRTVALGAELFAFDSMDDWVITAARRFRKAQVRGADTVCLDSMGRVCTHGLHFQEARRDGAYPIKVYALRPDSPASGDGDK